MRKLTSICGALVLAMSVATGCSTHTTETRDVVYDSRTGEPTTVERQTTTTTTDDTHETGVLSGTVNVIGEVLALPFKAVGALLSAIF